LTVPTSVAAFELTPVAAPTVTIGRPFVVNVTSEPVVVPIELTATTRT